MTNIPDELTGLPVDDQISSLLMLGWTHEEIATAANVSKGTIQNYKDQLMDGKVSLPPAAIRIIRSRQREFHRASRNSGVPNEKLVEQLAHRLRAIITLDLLDITPDSEINYEDIVAFAELIAAQTDSRTPPEIVAQLSRLTELGSDLPETVHALRLQRARLCAEKLALNIYISEITDNCGLFDNRYSDGVHMENKFANRRSIISDSDSTSTKYLDEISKKESIFGRYENNIHELYTINNIYDFQLSADDDIIHSNDPVQVVKLEKWRCLLRGGKYDERTGLCHFERYDRRARRREGPP